MRAYLTGKGYIEQAHPSGNPLTDMRPGTFCVRMNVIVRSGNSNVNIPIDVIVQPMILRASQLPILFECKSAGDYTNVNKRRKEEATKMTQLRETYGTDTVPVEYILF